MKKTFTTNMQDKVGSFVKASKIVSELGLNITRVSYNKAVDTHTLFLEVEGDENQLKLASEKLAQNGFLYNELTSGKVVLIEFKLEDKPGVLVPVLDLIGKFNFNISYISSQANGLPHQNFRMGLFIENPDDLTEFLNKASLLCKLKIIDYDSTEKVLDNTVFYLNFANSISEKLKLDNKQKSRLIVNSNLIMETLGSTTRKAQKTFDYISRFADFAVNFKHEKFKPRITCPLHSDKYDIIIIEPPCGSNTIIFSSDNGVLVVDGGFTCYKEETIEIIRSVISDFEKKEKALFLTHADVDHVGLVEYFDKIYATKETIENFVLESQSKPDFRENNPNHAPYVKISKILTSYKPINPKKLTAFDDRNAEANKLLNKVCNFKIFGLNFTIYLGAGGHTKGETVFIEENLKVVLSGDLYINLNDLIIEQKTFNKIAPYLMTSVDTDKELANKERVELFNLVGGNNYLIIGSHGAPKTIN